MSVTLAFNDDDRFAGRRQLAMEAAALLSKRLDHLMPLLWEGDQA